MKDFTYGDVAKYTFKREDATLEELKSLTNAGVDIDLLEDTWLFELEFTCTEIYNEGWQENDIVIKDVEAYLINFPIANKFTEAQMKIVSSVLELCCRRFYEGASAMDLPFGDEIYEEAGERKYFEQEDNN